MPTRRTASSSRRRSTTKRRKRTSGFGRILNQVGAISLRRKLNFKDRRIFAFMGGFVVLGVVVVAFSMAASAATSLWSSSARPAVVSATDTQAVELGVKFKSSQAGVITGIRYYKSRANTGVHTGSLWTTGGVRLATATFTNEGTSGWQTVNFAHAVPVTAGTLYVASYHTAVGHYSYTSSYFAKAHSRGALTSPANTATEPNGIYAYGAGAFPTNGYGGINYWVDVLFTANPSTPSPSASSTPTSTPATPTPTSTPATPAPTPTATPVAGGTPGPSACAPVPAFPDANCTGYAHTGVTLHACSLPLTQPSYDSCLFTGEVNVSAANIHVSRSKIVGNVAYRYADDGSLRGLVLTDVEIDSSNALGGASIGNNDYTCIRCNVHGGTRGLNVGGNVVIQDSYSHGWHSQTGDHITGIGSNGGAHNVIDHNNISCDILNDPTGYACSSGISVYGDDAPGNNDWTITNNLINSGSSYCMVIAGPPSKPYPFTNVHITGNHFGNMGARARNLPDSKCTEYGPISTNPSSWGINGNVWSGNVDSNGGAVTPN